MSIGTILLIVLIIILLGGFSGIGGGPCLWDRLLRGRRARTRGRYPLDLGLARQAVKGRSRLQLRWSSRRQGWRSSVPSHL
jgi:hypothetical protein